MCLKLPPNAPERDAILPTVSNGRSQTDYHCTGSIENSNSKKRPDFKNNNRSTEIIYLPELKFVALINSAQVQDLNGY